jgi:4-amino-4-deoxy-L-arabinose transferase-like glycosyltransferase
MNDAARAQRWVARWGWVAAVLVVAGAALLRLSALGAVGVDPFYDAAVKSMGSSWHNFFFGAFEPGGSVSIDKPPVDLWLQVASVKLFGFTSTALKLPEVLGGIAAVALLYAAVRRVYGFAAGLGAALALALMPIEVITARSDTMDAVMMALLVATLLLLIKACESGRTAWLLAAAAALGVAFNVKLLESVVAMPGLATIALLGFSRSRSRVDAAAPSATPPGADTPADAPTTARTRAGVPRAGVLHTRVLPLAGAAVVFVVVALSWLSATLLFPAHERPYAIGSTNGSAWNAAFVFNGWDRVTGKAVEAQETFATRARHAPTATLSEREHIPIVAPGATRLLSTLGPLSGERLGIEALIALLLGVPAVAWGLRGPPLKRALGIGLVVWLLTGLVLFSQMTRLHPRYVEGFTPAVAALVGIGVAWATQPRARKRVIFLVVALLVLLAYGAHLLGGTSALWWAMLACGAAAVVLVLFDRVDTGVAAVTLTWVAVLAIPTSASLRAVRLHVSDAGDIGALPANELLPLSNYLLAHREGARYEVAVDSATQAGALIVRDGLPVVMLTTYEARTLTSIAQLERLIALGEVRYAFLSELCGARTVRTNSACSPPALWVRAHAIDVSKMAGLPHRYMLWRLPGRYAAQDERRERKRNLAARADGAGARGRQTGTGYGVHGRGSLSHAAVPRTARGRKS